MNEVFDTIMTRRSVRSFSDKNISREDLLTIAKAGVHAPSGMNRQSWKFTVVQNQEKIQKLAKAVAKQLEKGDNYNFYLPNAIILVSNDRENTNGLADSACAMENMFLMAHSMGVGSVWINQLKCICDEPAIRTILDEFEVPANHIVYGIAALGYAKEEGKPKEKNETVIHFVDQNIAERIQEVLNFM